MKIHNLLKKIHIPIALIMLVAGAFFGLYKLQATTLIFNNNMESLFPGIDINNSSIDFNSSPGMIFWASWITLSTPEIITISGSSNSIRCTKQLEGIYYNSQRGESIRPLDTHSKGILALNNSIYYGLAITWGLYTECVATTGSLYTPNSTAIYGQVRNTRSGTEYYLVAWLNYDFTWNSILGLNFATTWNLLTIVSPGVISGFIYDSYGGIGRVGTVGNGCITNCNLRQQQQTTGNTDCTLTIYNNQIPQGNNTVVACEGNNAGWYGLSVFKLNPISLVPWYTTTGNSRNIGSSLSTGLYAVTCSNSQWGQCAPTQIITVTAQTGWSCNLWWNISIVTVTGVTMEWVPNYYYSRTTWGIDITISSTQPANYTIMAIGGITNSITGYYAYSYNRPTETRVNTGKIYLTTGDGQKQLSATFITGSCIQIASPKFITLDLLPPTNPTLLYPTNGTGICFLGTFTPSRTGAGDAGVGIAYYNYKIFNNTTFTGTTIINGTTTGTSVTLNANQLWTTSLTGNYYREVQAVDKLGQGGSYTTGYFTIQASACANSGNIQLYFTLPDILNAEINTEYTSAPFKIPQDITDTGVFAYISTGILYVNGTGNSTTGFVNRDSVLKIKLKSSNQYNTTVNSTFFIGTINIDTFSITTRSLTGNSNPTGTLSGCMLTTSQKLLIREIFDLMKDTYDEKDTTLSDFLFTMQSMLEDNIGINNNCSLEYLLELTNEYIEDNIQQNIDESEHKAPNCKAYAIKYDDKKLGYTSKNLKKKVYFASREALTRYIDTYNPGDCRKNIYENIPTFDNTEMSGSYIAPNGKMYEIKEKQGSWNKITYYSPDFIKIKYYESIEDIEAYIDTNNPLQEVWDHEVDSSFTPVTYVTANYKEYKIYNTDKWFMSYKLMKVMYFNSLEEIKSYINTRNPRK